MKFVSILATLLFLFSYSNLSSQVWMEFENSPKNMHEISESYFNYWGNESPGKGMGWKPFKRLENFWSQRIGADGKFPNQIDVFKEVESFLNSKKKKDQLLDDEPEWTLLGPTRRPALKPQTPQSGMGRINTIAFDPDNDNIIWAGAATGGVWKSTNGGTDWFTFPFTSIMSIGISDIQIAPNNSNIVYAATGDSDAGGFFGVVRGFSVGVMKTTNGGTSWTRTNLNIEPANGLLINRMLVHPSNPNIVFIASNAGILGTTDGGSNWYQYVQGICRDMEFKVDDPTTLFACFIENNQYTFRTVNLSNTSVSDPLPLPGVGRPEIAVTKANANYVYMLNANNDQGFHSLLKSTDAGKNWFVVADGAETPNYLHSDIDGGGEGGQGIYDLAIAISPYNENEVYIGGVNLWKSVNGGVSFSILTSWTGVGAPWIHADQHCLVFDSNGNLYSGNDGGIHKTTDRGTSWSDLSDGLEITQFYKSTGTEKNKNLIVAGSQDNGTSMLKNGQWKTILGGDGMDCLIDQEDERYIYTSLYYGSVWRSTDGGDSFLPLVNQAAVNEAGAWVTPYVFDPQDTKTIYIGYQNIFKLENRGETGERLSNFGLPTTVRHISVAPSNSDFIYVLMNWDGESYKMIRTTDGGRNWGILITAGLPFSSVAVDPKSPEHFWFTLGGYGDGEKVYEFTGTEFVNVSGSLPNVPVNCIAYQNDTPDRLYIGTDIGVLYKDNNMEDWELYGVNLPNVVINDLDIVYSNGVMRAATYGRGLWEVPVSNCSLQAPDVEIQGKTSLCEGETTTLSVPDIYKSYEWNNGETTNSIVVDETGDYYCTVTDNQNCKASTETVSVTVNPVPDLKLRALGGNPFCQGDTITLTASISFEEFLWSTGETDRNIKVWQPGEYSCKGTTDAGCIKIDTIMVEMLDAPDKPVVTKNETTLTSSEAQAYQWYKDGKKISGATSRDYTVIENGIYYVEISSENGCKAVSEPMEVIVSSVDDQEVVSSYLVVRPNPASEQITVESFADGINNYRIRITDILGKNCYSGEYNSNSQMIRQKIDISNLEPGVYIIILESGSKLLNTRFVKE